MWILCHRRVARCMYAATNTRYLEKGKGHRCSSDLVSRNMGQNRQIFHFPEVNMSTLPTYVIANLHTGVIKTGGRQAMSCQLSIFEGRHNCNCKCNSATLLASLFYYSLLLSLFTKSQHVPTIASLPHIVIRM